MRQRLDISMIVPAHEMPRAEDTTDPSEIPTPDPILHDIQNALPLKEGELIITKDHPSSTEWFVAEIYKVLPNQITVMAGRTFFEKFCAPFWKPRIRILLLKKPLKLEFGRHAEVI